MRQVQQQLTQCQAQSTLLRARAEAASGKSAEMGEQLQVAQQSALQARLQSEEVQRKLESALADMATLEASTKSCQVIINMPAASMYYHTRSTHMLFGHLLTSSRNSCHALPVLLSENPFTCFMLKVCHLN